MKKILLLIFVLTILLLLKYYSFAETVEGYFVDQSSATGGASAHSGTEGKIYAQSFIPTVNSVAAVSGLFGYGDYANGIVELRRDESGVPSDIILGTSTTVLVLSPFSYTGVIFDPPISVTPGETYYIVFYKDPLATEEIRPWVSGTETVDTYPNGHAYYKEPSGEWIQGVPPIGNPQWDEIDDYSFSEHFIGEDIVPIADAGEDIVSDANENITLDGSSSYDPDGTITNYRWVRVPDRYGIYSGTEPTCETKALGRVEEIIELTVTDNFGFSSPPDTVKVLSRTVQNLQDKIDELNRQINPSISIISPQDGSTLSGVITIATQTTDENFQSVLLYVNDILKDKDSLAPFEFTFDTTTVPDGMCTIKTTGWHKGTRRMVSDTIEVTVDNEVDVKKHKVQR